MAARSDPLAAFPATRMLDTALSQDRRQVLADLARGHGTRLLAIARRILRNEDDARDAVQQGLLRALRGLDRFDDRSSLSTWLYRVVTNAALDIVRARRRCREDPLDAAPPGVAARDADAESAIIEAEERSQLYAALAAMPRAYRSTIEDELSGLGLREAAAARGVTPLALKSRRFRARQHLRHRMATLTGTTATA